jgi:hypothetical protein
VRARSRRRRHTRRVARPRPATHGDQGLHGCRAGIGRRGHATLLGEEDSVIASAEYSWDAATTTVVLTVTLAPTYENSAGTMAWILSRDRAMDLWDRATPFRAEAATIRPGLVVTVDGTRFVSGFDLCVQLADQTIVMREWNHASL